MRNRQIGVNAGFIRIDIRSILLDLSVERHQFQFGPLEIGYLPSNVRFITLQFRTKQADGLRVLFQGEPCGIQAILVDLRHRVQRGNLRLVQLNARLIDFYLGEFALNFSFVQLNLRQRGFNQRFKNSRANFVNRSFNFIPFKVRVINTNRGLKRGDGAF